MTRYDLFRKRIAPIAFIIALGAIVYDTCNKQERTRATIVFDYGAAQPQVRALDGEVWMNDAKVAQFHQLEEGHIGATKFDLSLPAKDGEVVLDVEMSNGVHKQIRHSIHLLDAGGKVFVRLEPDLK